MKKIYLLLIMASLAVCGMAQDRPAAPEQVKVRFFPNPASTVINFEFNKPGSDTYTLQVYNFIGKKVSELVITNNKASVSLDNYFRGVYIFQLRDKAGKIIQSGKFHVIK